MEILQVSKFYSPHVGGIERVVQQLAEGFTQRGHDVTVLAAMSRGIGNRESINEVPVVRTSSIETVLSTPLSPSYPIRLRRLSGVDIVHVHLPNPLAVVSELFVDRTDTPVVVTYHSDIVRQQTAKRLYRPFLRRFLDQAEQLITTSPRLMDNSDMLAEYRDRCAVVPLSVPIENDPDLSRASASQLVDADGPYVLFVGRLNYYKGVEYLIKAMSTVEGTLLVVGDGPKYKSLKKQAATSDASVVFLGHVDDETLERCYMGADVFVLPSVEPSEAFGIVQLEAMKHGLPVVNTELPTGVPWVSEHGETGLTVEPRNSAELAEAISTLLADDELRHRLSENARDRVVANFSEKRMIEDTLKLYKTIC